MFKFLLEVSETITSERNKLINILFINTLGIKNNEKEE